MSRTITEDDKQARNSLRNSWKTRESVAEVVTSEKLRINISVFLPTFGITLSMLLPISSGQTQVEWQTQVEHRKPSTFELQWARDEKEHELNNKNWEEDKSVIKRRLELYRNFHNQTVANSQRSQAVERHFSTEKTIVDQLELEFPS